MRTREVLVAHRAAMVAEGIAAALARYPQIIPIGVTTSSQEAERRGEHADVVVIDQYLAGAALAGRRLRSKGVRVVVIGGGDGEEEEVRVSSYCSIATLAEAIAPGIPLGYSGNLLLTEREREVLALVGRGLAGKQVARHLGISPKTVEHHKTRIFSKLGVSNQAAAVGHAMAGDLARMAPWSQLTT